jgi:site-specific DNA-cytosine methylase
MRVIIGCEYSGVVRDAFRARGHDAWSCDLLPSEVPGNHYQCDIFEVINRGWDLGIFHPPCTDLAVSGARHFAAKKADGRQDAALDFVRRLLSLKIPKIALENPVSIISSHIRKPDQIIQPWQFGHPEQKATCLWLKGLPLLKPTNNVYDMMMTLPAKDRERVHRMPPGPDRWKERSRTFQGIATAMAEQWG